MAEQLRTVKEVAAFLRVTHYGSPTDGSLKSAACSQSWQEASVPSGGRGAFHAPGRRALTCKTVPRSTWEKSEAALPLLLRVAAAARHAGIGEHHARELVASGEWASIRRGRRILVVRSSIDAWAERLAKWSDS